jgi:succinate-acetate transporter protein
MSSLEERFRTASAGTDAAWENGFARPRVVLTPVAAPSVLGLFGFAIATFMVAANIAGWYGTATTPLALAPLAFAVGGVAQLAAGMWAYRARDVLATAMHGVWGGFWIGYGILQLLVATGTLAAPTPAWHSPALGFWFFALAAVTASGALAAVLESIGLFATLTALAAGSAFLTVGYLAGSHFWWRLAGWVLVVAAGLAWYTATAMLLEATSGRVVLPLGKWQRGANLPGARPRSAIELSWAEPGIKKGQ